MMETFEQAHFSVTVKLPRTHDYLRSEFRLSPMESVVFGPLPRDRELGFMVDARRAADAQKERRAMLVRFIAEQLAEHITTLIEKRDPQFGYSPEEWERMHRA